MSSLLHLLSSILRHKAKRSRFRSEKSGASANKASNSFLASLAFLSAAVIFSIPATYSSPPINCILVFIVRSAISFASLLPYFLLPIVPPCNDIFCCSLAISSLERLGLVAASYNHILSTPHVYNKFLNIHFTKQLQSPSPP